MRGWYIALVGSLALICVFAYDGSDRIYYTGSRFRNLESLGSYVQLVVDEERDQLLVGGKNALYRLALDNLVPLESVDMTPHLNFRIFCENQGYDKEMCHNFIRVLLIENRDLVFVCGTNAYRPLCFSRNITNLSSWRMRKKGHLFCPFSPLHTSTALMTSEHDVYAATELDKDARDIAVVRRNYYWDKHGSPPLRTRKYDSYWLNEPNFVSTYEIGNFVYFFFRETATEHKNCGKIIFSRVARVCKGDNGDSENHWTTFRKARLNCSLPGEFPFYFDELQSTYFHEKEGLIYALFTTPPNGMAGSAVCVFNIADFPRVFGGRYKSQETYESWWLPIENKDNNNKCSKLPLTTDKPYIKLDEDNQLMDEAVTTRQLGPLIMKENERWTHILVDQVVAKSGTHDVVFVATQDGKLRKMIRLPNAKKSCLIEEISLLENGQLKPVTNMKISTNKGAIYASVQGDIIKIPVQNCGRFVKKFLCIKAQDPYCGWDTAKKACTPPPNGNPQHKQWKQKIYKCPVTNRWDFEFRNENPFLAR